MSMLRWLTVSEYLVNTRPSNRPSKNRMTPKSKAMICEKTGKEWRAPSNGNEARTQIYNCAFLTDYQWLPVTIADTWAHVEPVLTNTFPQAVDDRDFVDKLSICSTTSSDFVWHPLVFGLTWQDPERSNEKQLGTIKSNDYGIPSRRKHHDRTHGRNAYCFPLLVRSTC